MTRINASIVRTIVISFCMMSANAIAENTDFSNIEAQERAQIISELTFNLDTKQICTQKLIWDDSGSGADLDGYFFNPVAGNNEYIIGGHASQKPRSKYHCVTVVSLPTNMPKGAPPLLVSPVEWKQVWKDSGSGATRDGSFWQAIPPDNNYKCIGSISQIGHNKKPNLPNYRCVHTSLAEKIVASTIIWSDKGTGADKQVTIFGLPATGVFTAVASRVNKIETYNLKKNAASVPDAKMVEEILTKRMAPLKADIETKTRAIQEQKAAAKKEEANKAAAKKTEQKRIAAAEERKRQAKIAEQKALAGQVEKEDSAEEAEHLKKEQQARIAKAMEEKAAAEIAEQNIAKQEKESVSEQVQPEKVEARLENMMEEIAQIEPEIIKSVGSDSDSSSTSESGEESKGLSDILMFFVKVFGMMVGGVIVFIVAFKVLLGKKKST